MTAFRFYLNLRDALVIRIIQEERLRSCGCRYRDGRKGSPRAPRRKRDTRLISQGKRRFRRVRRRCVNGRLWFVGGLRGGVVSGHKRTLWHRWMINGERLCQTTMAAIIGTKRLGGIWSITRRRGCMQVLILWKLWFGRERTFGT
jgi:hypothetical protein